MNRWEEEERKEEPTYGDRIDDSSYFFRDIVVDNDISHYNQSLL